MTEEIKPKYLEEITRYQYADVSARLGSDKQTAPFAVGALEKLVDSFGMDKDMISGLREAAFASEEGIATAVKIYSEKYQNALNQSKVTEFYNLRLPTLTSLLGEEKAKEAQAVFEKYSKDTIGSITSKVNKAQAIMNSGNGFNNKEKEEAKKTLEKLGAIFNLIQLLEQRNYEELRNGATKSTYKDMITESLSKA